jgi:delta8-fatty-acid desaturase
MKTFAIGTKPCGVWMGNAPPIRGGMNRPLGNMQGQQPLDSRLGRRIPPCSGPSSYLAASKTEAANDEHVSTLSKAEYTDLALQQEIDRDLREFPSLDAAVQEDIVRKFRNLHQQIRDQGFYDCSYWEYGKEMLRYTGLFVAFLVALYHGWHIASACFLGGFWVCDSSLSHDDASILLTPIYSTRSCLPRTMRDMEL